MVDVFADFAMMIPDFSAGSWGSASSVSIDTSRLAAKAKQAKAATEKLLQSDEMQSRFHDALKQRNSERDPAAPDTSKLDALHALTEAARQTADQPSGDSTSAAESTPAASESADGQQETVPADKPGRINADRLLGQPAGNVITGQLGHRGTYLGYRSIYMGYSCIYLECRGMYLGYRGIYLG